MLLLIACADVATLLLARGVARHREVAIRAALGAPRSRIVRQFLLEAIILATGAGAVGVVFSFQAIELARPWLPLGLPLLHEMRINTAVANFAVICAILTACLTGIAPALRAARREKEGLAGREGVGLTPGRRRTNLVRTCVAAEVGLALMLLVGTGLLVRSALRAWQVDPGFDARNLLTMTVSLPENKVRVESQRGVCARGHRIGPLIAVCERRRSDSGAPNAFRELLRLRGHRRVCAEVGFR
jgi:hypothetical protein